jgi:alanyl-tRNA synthetase
MLFQASKSLVKKGFDCSAIAREAGKILKGGGGGKAEFAQVGGSDASAMRDAAGKAKNLAIERISAVSKL